MRSLRLAVLVAIVVVVASCSSGSERQVNNGAGAKVPPTPKPTIDELASGREAFQINCLKCHKADGSGGETTVEGRSIMVEDLRAEKIKKMTDEKIIMYMLDGVPKEGMPSFRGKISEGRMRDIVLYIRTEFHSK